MVFSIIFLKLFKLFPNNCIVFIFHWLQLLNTHNDWMYWMYTLNISTNKIYLRLFYFIIKYTSIWINGWRGFTTHRVVNHTKFNSLTYLSLIIDHLTDEGYNSCGLYLLANSLANSNSDIVGFYAILIINIKCQLFWIIYGVIAFDVRCYYVSPPAYNHD